MKDDAHNLTRTARRLIVEYRKAYGSPPVYDSSWRPVWGAKVDRIEINHGSRPSRATIWFPALRWEQQSGLIWGDMVRIRTDERYSGRQTVLFSGFITNYMSEFSGGTERPGSAYERNAVVCLDHRWLLSVTSHILGQFARGPDDFKNYGTDTQSPKDYACTGLKAQRTIFNINGRPNRDPALLETGSDYGDISIFCNPGSPSAQYWSIGQMLRYILYWVWLYKNPSLPTFDLTILTGLDHPDWDRVLNHIVVEGLNVLDVIEHLCKHLGWDFREDYYGDSVRLVFYKLISAAGYVRGKYAPTIFHRLHAPAVGENLAAAVARGEKLLWAMSLSGDIGGVINTPIGVGAPDRFEFTAELVPAWRDDTFAPDTSDDNAKLFFTEAELQDIEDKDALPFYSFYHHSGQIFNTGADTRNVGRRWTLNESGRYSLTPYARGVPFDFTDVVPSEYVRDKNGKRLFAPFDRRLLPCLTQSKDGAGSVGVKVEFSFDAGETWHVLPCSIRLLDNECGIYIEEPNLAEIADPKESLISEPWADEDEKELEAVRLNYYTSMCMDKLWSRSFKNRNDPGISDKDKWQTRLRVTAGVQLDQRVASWATPTINSGSPFLQSQLYDFSEKYGLAKRTESSSFADTPLTAAETNPLSIVTSHLDALRDANQDMSIAGQFTLERLWLGEGTGVPAFAVGDCIETITGRKYNLATSFGGGSVYPEIIQIVYLPDAQKMKLITRDLRFAEVHL